MKRLKKYALLIILVAFLAYGFLCGGLYFGQHFLIYEGAQMVPESVAIKKAAAQGLAPVRDENGLLIAYEFNEPENRLAHRGTAIIFHGKGGNALGRGFYAPALEKRGFHVIMFEYPGYEGRTGSASEAQMVREARALVNRLHREGKGPITLWGESLGTGVVGSVAADGTLPIAGLVLITPFDSLERIAASRYPIVPVSILMVDRYDSFVNLASFKGPIVVVQAANDHVVPAWSTDHLYECLPGRKLRIVLPNCGHNNWPKRADEAWWDHAADFVVPIPDRQPLKL